MAFALTNYIYPLENPIVVSGRNNYLLDNARSPEEIHFISDLVKESFASHHGLNSTLIEAFSHPITGLKDIQDAFVRPYIEKDLEAPLCDFLGQNWIIVRYHDTGEFDQVLRTPEALSHVLYYEYQTKSSFTKAYVRMHNYFELLFLLSTTVGVDYFGGGMMTARTPEALFLGKDIDNNLYAAFSSFRDQTSTFYTLDSTFTFSAVYEQLQKVAKSVEVFCSFDNGGKKPTPEDTLMFAADLLRIGLDQNSNIKISFLTLVSIIELMLTHNVDLSKNIEGSIRKQFVLKTSVVLYKTIPVNDLNQLKKELLEIYDLRSDIAHGNYLPEKKEERIDFLMWDLIKYVRAILLTFISDMKFVNFLKEN